MAAKIIITNPLLTLLHCVPQAGSKVANRQNVEYGSFPSILLTTQIGSQHEPAWRKIPTRLVATGTGSSQNDNSKCFAYVTGVCELCYTLAAFVCIPEALRLLGSHNQLSQPRQ